MQAWFYKKAASVLAPQNNLFQAQLFITYSVCYCLWFRLTDKRREIWAGLSAQHPGSSGDGWDSWWGAEHKLTHTEIFYTQPQSSHLNVWSYCLHTVSSWISVLKGEDGSFVHAEHHASPANNHAYMMPLLYSYGHDTESQISIRWLRAIL